MADLVGALWLADAEGDGRLFENCRSEPARDSGRSVGANIDCTGAIASRLAPTGIAVIR
ncbi:hypothetical protein EMIT0215P_10443 [Pseudomonas serboccidentalis]